MSPILVRPVREQLEHDRVIRLLQVRLKRRHDVAANIGEDQTVPVEIGPGADFSGSRPDVDRPGPQAEGTVEVETAESVNHLEAMAQWAHLGRARAPFHLYVPGRVGRHRAPAGVENHVNVAEIWSYHTHRRPDAVHARLSCTGRDMRRAAAENRRAAPKPAVWRARRAARGRARPGRAAKAATRRAAEPAETRRAEERRAFGEEQAARAQDRGARAEEEVSPAVPRFSRDKRGYENTFVVHTGRAPREVPLPNPLLVPDAARCARRPVRARRRCDPPDRTAQSRRRVRLDAHPEGTGCAPGTEAGAPSRNARARPRPREVSTPPHGHPREPPRPPIAARSPFPNQLAVGNRRAGSSRPSSPDPRPSGDRREPEPALDAAVRNLEPGGLPPEGVQPDGLRRSLSRTGMCRTIARTEPSTAAQARLGFEGLSRLRARHAEVLARISEKVTDPGRRDELKSDAERLNPDTWVTDAEVTAGLESYETVFESLRGVVGRRRKRRGRPSGAPGASAQPRLRRTDPARKSGPNEPGEDV